MSYIALNAEVSCDFCRTSIFLPLADRKVYPFAYNVDESSLILCPDCTKAHRLVNFSQPIFGIAYGTHVTSPALELHDLLMGPIPTCPSCGDTARWCSYFREGNGRSLDHEAFNPDADMIIDTPECSE